MLIGVPKEIKDSEYRVGLVPSTVRELTRNGHRVLVEKSAGLGAGIADAHYHSVGAEIVPDADQVYARSELIVKVKDLLAPERKKLRSGQVLFTYLHLAADPQQTADLVASGVIAIAYETVTSPQGTLPLLTPMSEVAGRMAPHVGARCLETENGGRGVLLGGVPGVPPADVVILGGGVAGSPAAPISAGMGAAGARIDRNPEGRRRVAKQPRAPGGPGFSTKGPHRDAGPPCGSRDRLGADPGRRRAKTDHRRHRQGDEGGLRHRGHSHRSRRVLRDVTADDALGADLYRLRRRALLRHQHAGRGRPHVDVRSQQRDVALRAGACRQRLSPRAGRR